MTHVRSAPSCASPADEYRLRRRGAGGWIRRAAAPFGLLAAVAPAACGGAGPARSPQARGAADGGSDLWRDHLTRESSTPPGEDGAPDGAASRAKVYKVPLGSSPARGAASALVTIVEFTDYQCGFCARVESTLSELTSTYRDALRVIVKNAPLPFHDRAEPAAEAALEVRAERGDAAFWAMHESLFAHQEDLSDDVLVGLAAAAGARAEGVRDAIREHRHASAIESDMDLAQDFDVQGTPHFFINGRRFVGAQPKEAFVSVVDEELEKARALTSAGIKPEAVYLALTKAGADAPEPERKEVAALPAGDPTLGSAGAKVVVHEFADFQCPFCARAEPVLREVVRRFGSKVRFVWHDLPLPFHDRALVAARAAREARAERGDRGFWDYHDRLFQSGETLSRGELEDAARAVGLDLTRFGTAIDASAHDGAIEADRAAADALDLSGTPSFVIVPAGRSSGFLLVGAQSFPRFRRLIERALAEAK